MTIILNATALPFAVHVSDRQLTKRIGDKFFVHSGAENKTIIVRLADALCVMGYTGAAYIQGVITDEWLASTIAGEDLTGEFMIRQPGIGRLKLNTMLRRLEAALRGVILSGSSNYLGVTISGFRQRGNYAVPFLVEMERNRGVFMSNGRMRMPRSPLYHALAQMGDPPPFPDLMTNIGKHFEAHGPGLESFRRGLVDTALERAAASQVVGDELMVVTMRRVAEGWDVVWTFESPRSHQAVIITQRGEIRIPSYFSPWIMTPGSIAKPSFGNGHLEHVFENTRVRCGNEQGGSTGSGVLMAVSSQRRVGAP